MVSFRFSLSSVFSCGWDQTLRPPEGRALFWTYPTARSGPYLLIIDIGQDAGNNLQEEDDEQQDEVLGSRDQ